MNINNLPVEILLIIFRLLDLKSLKNLYDTGNNYMKNIVCMHDTIKQCHLSMNTLATAQSLKLNFIKDISGHLLELNMCGVQDLHKTLLLPAIKKMKCLLTLNVSYTNINFLDFIDVYQACPSIKNICINFTFTSKNSVTEDVITNFQNIFERFENVHFIGSSMLYLSRLPFIVLRKAKLNDLKYTIALEKENIILPFQNMNNFQTKVQFNRFIVYMLNWVTIPSILENCEFLVIQYCKATHFYKIYCSKMLEKFCLERFGELVCFPDKIITQIFFTMYWNKDSTEFDTLFFCKLHRELDELLPQISYSEATDPTQKLNQPFFRISDVSVKRKSTWFLNSPNIKSGIEQTSGPAFRKMRIVSKPVTLDYDKVLKNHQNAELCINFCGESYRNSVTLSPINTYLKKLSLLSLGGNVRYSADFFKILFQCCDKLVTLRVEGPSTSPCAVAVSKYIQLSRSIKNVYLIENSIDFNKLFLSLSLCQTLENVHIHDTSSQNKDIANPNLLVEKCDNLYCLIILANMTETARVAKSQILKKAKSKFGRNYLRVELLKQDTLFTINPFIEVFRIGPFK